MGKSPLASTFVTPGRPLAMAMITLTLATVRSRLEYTYSVVAIDGTLGRVRPGNATEAAMEAKLVLKLA